MRFIFILGLIAIAFLSIGSCNLLTVDESNLSDYPTHFERLQKAELVTLNDEYHAANDYKICSTLNEFGFTGYSENLKSDDDNSCLSPEIEITTTDDVLISVAKKALLRNSKYTGVTDISALRIIAIAPINENGITIAKKITFAEQMIDSAIVEETGVIVSINQEGVYSILGNWYPVFTIPKTHNYNPAEIKQAMTGWEINMQYHTGQQEVYTVSENDLKQKASIAYLPLESEEGLEIHTCWMIPVSYDKGESKGWMAYFDVINGRLLKMEFHEAFGSN